MLEYNAEMVRVQNEFTDAGQQGTFFRVFIAAFNMFGAAWVPPETEQCVKVQHHQSPRRHHDRRPQKQRLGNVKPLQHGSPTDGR